jgi:TPR repeat protein
LYYSGEGVKRDLVEAIKWYRLAAAQGNASALNNIGLAYEYGLGVNRDMKQAVKWYVKAAEADHQQLHHILAEKFSSMSTISERANATAVSFDRWIY